MESTKPKFDMHVHSIYSIDGVADAKEICRKAKANGVTALSVTDHNHTKIIKDIKYLRSQTNAYDNITFINGAEVSCSYERMKGSIHINAYDFDENNKEFSNFLFGIRERDRAINYNIFAVLEKNFGFVFHPGAIMKLSAIDPDITYDGVAELCVKAGYLHNKDEFKEIVLPLIKNQVTCSHLNRYNTLSNVTLKKSDYRKMMLKKAPYIRNSINPPKAPDIKITLNKINNANGIACLNHLSFVDFKKRNRYKNMELFVKKTKEYCDSIGLPLAIEVFFSGNDKDQEFIFALALKYDILINVGTDWHSEAKDNKADIGTLPAGIEVNVCPLYDFIKNGRDMSKINQSDNINDYFTVLTKEAHEAIIERNNKLLEKHQNKSKAKIDEAKSLNTDKRLPIDDLREYKEGRDTRFIVSSAEHILSRRLTEHVSVYKHLKANIKDYPSRKKDLDRQYKDIETMYLYYEEHIKKLPDDKLDGSNKFKLSSIEQYKTLKTLHRNFIKEKQKLDNLFESYSENKTYLFDELAKK